MPRCLQGRVPLHEDSNGHAATELLLSFSEIDAGRQDTHVSAVCHRIPPEGFTVGPYGTTHTWIALLRRRHESHLMTQTLKVSSKSVPHSVAGALAGIMREHVSCDMQVIGAGALNQAIKAVAIARTYLVDDAIDVCCIPEFSEVDIDGRARTAIRLVVAHLDGFGDAEVDAVGFDAR